MSEYERRGKKFGVPEVLVQKTIDTMPVEEIFVVQPELYGKVEDTVWTSGDGALPEKVIIEGDRNVDPIKGSLLDDSAILAMRTVAVSGGVLKSGIICDFRHFEGKINRISGEVDIMSDQENAMAILDGQQNERTVSAVIVVDEDGKPDVWGDSAFFGAALYMASEVDKFYELVNEPDEDEDMELEPEPEPEPESSEEGDQKDSKPNQQRALLVKKLISLIARNQ